MRDFLTFQTFITPSLLIFIYYIGAILIPYIGWYITKWIQRSYFSEISKNLKETITTKQRVIIYTIFILCFICMEIFWRIIFEFFIAYFNMHDALMKL